MDQESVFKQIADTIEYFRNQPATYSEDEWKFYKYQAEQVKKAVSQLDTELKENKISEAEYKRSLYDLFRYYA